METTTTSTATGNGTRATVVEDEVDLTVEPVRWTAPGTEIVVREPEPEPQPVPDELPSVADHQHHIWPVVLGTGAVLVIILLSSLLGILFNRVDDLEHQVDRLQKTVQQQN